VGACIASDLTNTGKSRFCGALLGCLRRTLVLAAWFVSGVVVAQEAGPVLLTGQGGVEAAVTPAFVGAGGAVATDGLYTVHTYTGSGLFVPPEGVTQVEVLVVGGGGGGARAGNNTGTGGGGGGGIQTNLNVAVSGQVLVTVGAGGLGATSNANGASGQNSVFNSPAPITAFGGGGGATANVVGLDGGSGGGGGSNGTLRAGGSGSQGFDGGDSFGGNNAARAGGGGGGGGGEGADATSGNGGDGGDGFLSSITGTPIRYAAGGGGSGPSSGGTGGLGGGGNGGTGAGQSATIANSGSGGGGGRNGNNGGNGADGVVIVRYLTPTTVDDYHVHVFTTAANFIPPAGVASVDVLAVGGGGGGGGDRRGGGGGGAGGVNRAPSVAVTAGDQYAITVGSGGNGGTGTGSGQDGILSSFANPTLVANPGGGGGRGDTPANGADGGSGGGGGGPSNTTTGGTGSQGGSGAGGTDGANSDDRGGGGGGAGGSGTRGTGTNPGSGGVGGIGLQYGNLFGVGLGAGGWIAGGGGGGKREGNGGAPGQGGGGAGSGAAGNPVAGVAGTGGGGGGRGGDTDGQTGASGGSGVVAVRYRPATMRIDQELDIPRTVLAGAILPQNIIIEILDADGNAVPGVEVTAVKSFGDGTLGGTLVRDTDGNGQAIFDDLDIDLGSGAHRIRFTAEYSSAFVETEDIEVVEYRFEINHILSTGLCASATAVTISIFDSNDAIVDDFDGIVTITNTAGRGGYTVNTGTPGNLTDADADDGAATYEFDPSDGGFVILDFSTTTADEYEFIAVSGAIETENYDGPLVVAACEFRISHDLSAGSCAQESITIGVYADNALVTNYVGGVTLSVSGVANGNWSKTTDPNDAQGDLINPPLNDGIATYNFVAGDGGEIVLNFRANAGTANFNVVADAGNVSSPVGPYDDNLVIYSCSFRISHDGAGSVCTPDQITIGVYANNALVNYTGNVNITTVGVTGGNWTETTTPTDSNGTLDNGVLNNGSATYTFVAADAGEIILNFQAGTTGNANFNIVAAGVSAPVAPFDDDLVLTACTFRVTHSGSMDVCSVEEVTITLVDTDGLTLEDYTGQITLSTTTGNGGWAKTADPLDAEGNLTDPVLTDGTATYVFVLADEGSITLAFTHSSSSGVVNINVSDGVSLDPRSSASAFDQNIVVAICTIEIVHSGNITACEIETVEITVRDSLGGLAEDYEGTLNLSTSTNHGNWLIGDADGVLTETAGDDNGVATYKFAATDNGYIELLFSSPHAEIVNFNMVDGAIIVDVNADPNLRITSCLPDIFGNASCTVGTSTTLAIPLLNVVENQRGRMVLMIIAGADDVALNDAFPPLFAGQEMTLIRRQLSSLSEGSMVEMWGILEDQLPDGSAGPYTGSFTGGPTGAAMCLLAFDQVSQSGFPQPATPADTGPVNSSEGAGARSTTITTPANNALVVSAVNLNVSTALDFEAPQPDYMTRVFGQTGTPIANPTGNGSRFGGSVGRQPSAGITTSIEVTTFANFFPSDVGTHVVASFRPLVAGEPLAANYEPVVLFRTMSGNLSYRAIGATLRSTFNEDAPSPLGCNFLPFADGAAAQLTLPADSTVKAAYLYWSGSGDAALGHVDADVDFGLTGSEVPLTAEEVFIVDGVGIGNLSDYFAAFADVTALVTGSGEYTLKNLVVQNGTPWSDYQACAGGWALVVAYEHEFERLRVLNFFHGFQPFWNSSFTLVPRNFRMASNDQAENLPNGQVTHITIEGDETLNSAGEGLELQEAPNSTVFIPMVTQLNPAGQEFNSTITRPIYDYSVDTGYFEFDESAGYGGYEIDVPGPEVNTGGPRFGNSWGLDVDTHYFQGGDDPDDPMADPNVGENLLYPFAIPGAEAERITTRYSAGSDLVMLISEVISMTNYPVADLEVIKTEQSTFKVNRAGSYEINVRNNGDGGTGGYANGQIIVADILPPGMIFVDLDALDGIAVGVSGDDWACSVTAGSFDPSVPGAFTCVYNIAADWAGGDFPGRLLMNEYLPPITVNVSVGGSTFFPNQNNNAKNSVRLLHSGGSCDAAANGVIPDPDSCTRSPQFDNFNDLEGGNIDINDLDDKQPNNNNVDSVTTVVKGVEVNLSVEKFVEDILESGSEGVYTIRITNHGPDATTSAITLLDMEPSGVNFLSAVAPAGWSCTVNTNSLECSSQNETLAVGASIDILLTVDVTGPAGFQVNNTVTVTPGSFNFDLVPGNNTNTDITEIVPQPVATQERFLLSVSSLGGQTSIGGLTNFEDDDYIIYDPVSDVATMFFDNSVLGFNINDADAVHLLKNGHIVISAAAASSVGTGLNLLNFNPGDLVVYDPILGTTSMLFDASAIFGGANPDNVNITAVYVLENGDIIFAAIPDADTTIGGLSFTSADLILYEPDTGIASLFFEGANFFDPVEDADVVIQGFYLRVDPDNPSGTIDTLILSARDANDDLINIGADVTYDPELGTYFTQDDVTQINRDAPVPVDNPNGQTTENLFLGNVELGVFASSGDPDDLLIDALHVLEDGYIGHFRISEVGGDASVCSAIGLHIRISKHEGLGHTRDTDYSGSIRITTNTGIGNWTLISNTGGGTLNNGTADDGAAIYTFKPGDGGTVVLGLSQSLPGLVNVDVSNGIAREGHPPGVGAEAPIFTYDEGVTLNYLDNFAVQSYANQDGSNAWSNDWVENDTAGAGATVGDVRVQGGMAVFTRAGGTVEPSLQRGIDLSGATLDSDLILSFSYSFASLGTFEEFVVEARHNNLAAWQQVALYKRGTTLPNVASGSGLSGNLNISAVLLDDPTASTEIRFRIVQGYTTGATFSIDDVRLTATTTDCNVSPLGVNHYEISIGGVVNGTYNGVACVGVEVIITAHDANHNPVLPGVLPINLSTSRAGNWSALITGTGTLANGTPNDGAATYTFPDDENSVTLWFDYTGPETNPEIVNINVSDGLATEIPAEDPNYSVSQVGLRIINALTESAVNPIPLQIAGKPSNVNPLASQLYVQAVNSSSENPGVCEPLFAAGQTLELGFAAECEDPGLCVTPILDPEVFRVNGTSIALIDAPDPINYTTMNILLQDLNLGNALIDGPAAPITIDYTDVGKMRLHVSFDIPFGDDTDPLLATRSGDLLETTSNQFIVRPFAFDIDFNNGRALNGSADASYAADHTGSRWRIAGQDFSTTITAVGWQAEDDDLTNALTGDVAGDGIPDSDAVLSNNRPTPNFEKDTTAADYGVLLTVTANKAADALDPELGVLLGNRYDGFDLGELSNTTNYNEVGVIDMQATLVNNGNAEVGYLTSGVNVRGIVRNVGRFYPNRFLPGTIELNGRADLNCTPSSSFTYMGEEFEVVLALSAMGLTNSGNYITVNYRGDYALLDSFEELGLVAIEDIVGADDVNYTARLSNHSVNGLPSDFSAQWTNGVLSLSGNLVFARAADGAPDGPFGSLQIAFLPEDEDDVGIDPARIDPLTSLDLLNVDLDLAASEPGTNIYYLIDEHDFRYGRLLINNAYGPETEDLAVSFVVEYFNGTSFVRNTQDNCTLIDVDDLSYDVNSYTGELLAGDTTFDSPATVTFNAGQTQGLIDNADPSDAPLISSAAGEGNSGTVNVTLDLNAAGLSYLRYEWNDLDADDDPGADYDDDPVGVLEFGQYRMHDRVINWQEIYNAP